jgi:hypothetical protein
LNNLQSNIALFLKSPNDFDGREGVHSTLFLLRREASLCFGYDPNNNQKIKFEALFSATMAVLAGIDLVAKFVYRDFASEVGTRFTDFVSKYMDTSFHEELYQLRNSLLHSFGLYSETRNGKVYHFVLARDQGKLVQQVSDKSYLVDVTLLWKKFNESIVIYQRELMASANLQHIFSEMFPKYGLVGIQ